MSEAALRARVASLEAEVAALEQLLEVQERAVVEQSDRLERQTEELRRSNRELEMFAYVISHDLQEPLRMIASYTQLLAERYRGRLDERADKYIGYAVGGAKRMQQLINDLLAYSRVTSKGQPLQPVALDEVLAGVLVDLDLLIRETGATIHREPLPTVAADRSQVRQVFQNLISNSLSYRRPDVAPEVAVSCRQVGDVWEVAVRDNGVGIDPRHHERVFVIFQRLDRTRDGTGVGLALCRRIVERHGGRIWVESAAGAGSTFRFTLPAVEAT